MAVATRRRTGLRESEHAQSTSAIESESLTSGAQRGILAVWDHSHGWWCFGTCEAPAARAWEATPCLNTSSLPTTSLVP